MPNGLSDTPYSAYRKSSVETATPGKLLLMLFNGGIRFLHLGQRALTEKNYYEADKNLGRVQDILTELMSTLDMEQGGEIAAGLHLLYDFYRRQTIEANIKKDAALLDPVLEFFQTFRDTWSEAAQKARMGA